nr:hypothetical protein [Tanacetum cinerariifolium]
TSVKTQFRKQSILGKPHSSSSRLKLYFVTPPPKSKVFPKVGESNALSKPITSNSAPSSRKSTFVNNERVIAPGIFRINPFKASRYVSGMKSRKKNQSANVSKSANQKKHKADVKKSKKSGSKESLASPSKPRSFFRNLKQRVSYFYFFSWHVFETPKAEFMYLSASCLLNMIVMTSMIELESLFGHCSTNHSNGENQVVSKSFAVTTADAFDKRQQQQDSTSSTSTLATTITTDGIFDL